MLERQSDMGSRHACPVSISHGWLADAANKRDTTGDHAEGSTLSWRRKIKIIKAGVFVIAANQDQFGLLADDSGGTVAVCVLVGVFVVAKPTVELTRGILAAGVVAEALRPADTTFFCERDTDAGEVETVMPSAAEEFASGVLAGLAGSTASGRT